MISEIIRPEKRDVGYEFDLPVIVVDDSENVVLLTEFNQDDENNFVYHGYYLESDFLFQPTSIYDYQIKHWSKFKGKVVLSNFAECE